MHTGDVNNKMYQLILTENDGAGKHGGEPRSRPWDQGYA